MLAVNQLNIHIKNRKLLEDINFSIQPGELFAIIGPNGAGKSTLLKALTEEIKYSGEIRFQQESIKKWTTARLAKTRAKFSQHHQQDIPLPVNEVVMMGRYPYFVSRPGITDLKVVAESLKLTEMSHFKDKSYNQLSGGEKQRIHLSRIFAQLTNNFQKKLMLLDEPLNNLDVYYQHKVLEVIKDFVKKGNMAAIVMHDLNLAAQFADRIVLLKDGKTVKYGNPKEVLTSKTICDVYDFPCKVMAHPLAKTPMIVFGEEKSASIIQNINP
ncbi:heme ABC transporter ATP-binding protein [Zunongwangia profunda]|uniref:heme ABC transporter ATP-binding protein n=1 Tax=Zunongwangia profunda TaxID=398743 RepID=UPI001D17DDFF|nr:heme ABC transporter ATP-binding protein [Zunongwangia profunda]MCC4227521.1 heme ABC transporter ATP-binding protein [Zunongwangia profunda]|tara:strand:- start:701 stop:1510 length:810 start_codon:yes stop_codon:yes gene_type:complete